eukprot:4634270-Amphidinium_carterae.2
MMWNEKWREPSEIGGRVPCNGFQACRSSTESEGNQMHLSAKASYVKAQFLCAILEGDVLCMRFCTVEPINRMSLGRLVVHAIKRQYQVSLFKFWLLTSSVAASAESLHWRRQFVI